MTKTEHEVRITRRDIPRMAAGCPFEAMLVSTGILAHPYEWVRFDDLESGDVVFRKRVG